MKLSKNSTEHCEIGKQRGQGRENRKTNQMLKITLSDGHWYLKPIILATQEAKMRKITVQNQLRQIVQETLSQKTHHKKGWWSDSRCRP
jgi:hypothetical protein